MTIKQECVSQFAHTFCSSISLGWWCTQSYKSDKFLSFKGVKRMRMWHGVEWKAASLMSGANVEKKLSPLLQATHNRTRVPKLMGRREEKGDVLNRFAPSPVPAQGVTLGRTARAAVADD
eukprot:3852046-Amphidinium_carterae.2